MEVVDEFFTYEGRLASFQAAHKKRASTASGSRTTKTIRWPHAHLKPEALAKAGWYYEPHPSHPDQVICFLCRKGLDGWEEGDDPLKEHIKHSAKCSWAVLAAVEAEMDDFEKEDPRSSRMMDARKATFGGRWPHESKKGWKCKTKQLVDAGWKYTPTADSDDMATCAYCQLALDGWEPGDKPLNEHYSRSPDCPFFTLVAEHQGPAKKSGRGKGVRASKASRLSGQSVATFTSEAPSDLPADHEDSIMTTTSVMTTASKKGGRGRKATAAKGKRTRAKKDEVVEVEEPERDVEMPPPPPPKSSRGRKRGSDAVEDSVLTATEAPAAKKRATRARGSNTIESSIMDASTDTVMADAAPAKKTRVKKGRGSSRSTRKASTVSIASTASLRSAAEEIPADDEIDRQLEADLERPLTDDEDDIMADSDSERRRSRGRKTKVEQKADSRRDYAMFDPAPVVPDEGVVEAELKALEAESQANGAEKLEKLEVPKKGRKAAGTRKASKQKKTKEAAKPAEPQAEPEPAPPPAPVEPEPARAPVESAMVEDELLKASITSTGTVVKTNEPDTELEPEKPVKRGRGRPPKKPSSGSARGSAVGTAVPEAASAPTNVEVAAEVPTIRESLAPFSSPQAAKPAPDLVPAAAPPPAILPAVASPTLAQPPPSARRLPQPPATPGHHKPPTPSARQAALSPSQSPQSSDAENQPPSSKPAASATTKRVVLAPVVATPFRASPSKRNRVAGLQSTTPWTAVDLDLVFGTPGTQDKENGVERLLGKGGELTSPEMRMTVEEWIYHNASQAEQHLKHECETFVSRFESEGTRAMRVLEGLVAE